MSHDCPECGELCYCDDEDTFLEEAPEDCYHDCHGDKLYEDDEDDDLDPYDAAEEKADAKYHDLKDNDLL